MSPPTAEELKAFRKAIGGVSQVKLAEMLGVSRRNVEDWEAGKSAPPAYLRLALAAINANLDPWKTGLALAQLQNEWAETVSHIRALEDGGLVVGDGGAHEAQLHALRRRLGDLTVSITRERGATVPDRFEVTDDGDYWAFVGDNPLVERGGAPARFRTIGEAWQEVERMRGARGDPTG